MTIEQLKATAVAYMTALSNNELALGESIITETFDQDQLTDELLGFLAILGEMTFAVLDGYSEALGIPAQVTRSSALDAFGLEAAGALDDP